ncbi:hypothetical protein D3C73_834930 [compost metagenome]
MIRFQHDTVLPIHELKPQIVALFLEQLLHIVQPQIDSQIFTVGLSRKAVQFADKADKHFLLRRIQRVGPPVRG